MGLTPLRDFNTGGRAEGSGVYITWTHNTVAQYIATRPIMDLFEESVQCSGTWVYKFWWDQECLELEVSC